MEKIIETSFLDRNDIMQTISALIAEKLLGSDQLSKIILRFRDLKDNFNALTFDECSNPIEQPLWRFSSGITPYNDYDDTSNIPIPLTHPLFINQDNIVSYDFPVWFNLLANQRIMMVTQDPMPRSKEWYKECRDAICSTTFGLHNASWRNKGNGGRRMWLLIQRLINSQIGVYLTDCKKLYIQSVEGTHIKETQKQIETYSQLLRAEVETIQPSLIVSFGNESKKQLCSLLEGANVHILEVPHFSGQAQGAIRNFFNWQKGASFSVDEQVKCYFELIINSIK